MTWKERVRGALIDVLPSFRARWQVFDAIGPIVEEEIAEMRRELGESLGRDALRGVELWEQAEQRAEQAEAHVGALLKVLDDRAEAGGGSLPLGELDVESARQWKAERD